MTHRQAANQDHEELSGCCAAAVNTDYMMCLQCFEHCDLLEPDLSKRDRLRQFRLAYRVALRQQDTTRTDWGDQGRAVVQANITRLVAAYEANPLPDELHWRYAQSRQPRHLSVISRTRLLLEGDPDNVRLRKFARSVIRQRKRMWKTAAPAAY
jgi:hypothetical protein